MKAALRFGSVAQCVTLASLTFGLAFPVSAAVVLVDFGSNSSFRGVSVPAPDPKSHYWNSIAPGAFVSNMVDINNAVTPVALGFDTPVGTDSFNGPAGATSFPPTAAEVAATDVDLVALGNLGVKEAAFDFAASPGGSDNRCRFQIQNLDPAQLYTLTLFGSHKFSGDDTTVYSVYSDNTYTTVVGTARLNVQTPGSPNLHNRDQVAVIADLSPQAGNILFVEFVGATGDLGYLNDFQLSGTVVPEPNAVLLLTAGASGALLTRRNRR